MNEAASDGRRIGGGVAPTADKPTRVYETQLIERVRAGDRAALRELVDLHKDRLFAFVWRMVRDHHEAEDVCQDAFLKAFGALSSFSTEYRFSTWLFTIAYRVCLNRIRRKRALTGEVDFAALPSGESCMPGAALESQDAARAKAMVWSAVDRLTPPQRATILLFYRHEMSCRDIAQVIELPLATVKSHLHRARARLRDELESMNERDLQQVRNLSQRAG